MTCTTTTTQQRTRSSILGFIHMLVHHSPPFPWHDQMGSSTPPSERARARERERERESYQIKASSSAAPASPPPGTAPPASTPAAPASPPSALPRPCSASPVQCNGTSESPPQPRHHRRRGKLVESIAATRESSRRQRLPDTHHRLDLRRRRTEHARKVRDQRAELRCHLRLPSQVRQCLRRAGSFGDHASTRVGCVGAVSSKQHGARKHAQLQLKGREVVR